MVEQVWKASDIMEDAVQFAWQELVTASDGQAIQETSKHTFLRRMKSVDRGDTKENGEGRALLLSKTIISHDHQEETHLGAGTPALLLLFVLCCATFAQHHTDVSCMNHKDTPISLTPLTAAIIS